MDNPNKYLIQEFYKYINAIQQEVDESTPETLLKNTIRLKKLKESLKIIKNFKNKINNGEDLKNIKGIGSGTIHRINEIIKNKSPFTNLTTPTYELEQVYGIGRKMAIKLAKQGINNVVQLLKSNMYNNLPEQIKIGLKYHNTYQRKIPRNEIKEINSYLQKTRMKISEDLVLTICGSYRRGKEKSNDIDILISHKKQRLKTDIIKKSYLDILTTALTPKFLLDRLSSGMYKYSGFCKFKNYPTRRIDIRYVPYDSYYTALLYFTGSAEFNVKLRNLSKQKGYKLNEYGLYSLTESEQLVKLKIKSEDDVFKYLGIKYVPPEDR